MMHQAEGSRHVLRRPSRHHGLWYRHPGGAVDGYSESLAVDPTQTSFHIFTMDGILGRDLLTTDSRNRLEGETPRRGER